MFGFLKRNRKPLPARPVEEIDAELCPLVEAQQIEAARGQKIDQLQEERSRAVLLAEEEQRAKQAADLQPEYERHASAWREKVAAIEDALQGLMHDFKEAADHGWKASRVQLRIERLGHRVSNPLRGYQASFLGYFTYERFLKLWKEAERPGALAPHQAAAVTRGEQRSLPAQRTLPPVPVKPSAKGKLKG